MIYSSILERLQPQDENEQPETTRRRVDDMLYVREWSTPGADPTPRADDVPDDAPFWWKGDEEASQSFLQSMGVDL